MPEGTWTCSNCGQIYSLAEPACTICRVTRENPHVIGKIETVRSAKPPPEKVEVAFPFVIQDARFNLPLDKGAVWSSGSVVATGSKDPRRLPTNESGAPGKAAPHSLQEYQITPLDPAVLNRRHQGQRH